MAEKEYIERGALQEIVYTRLKALEELYGAYDAYGSGYEECADRISEMPAADVVEVVRCGECVDYKCDTPYCQKHNKGYCDRDGAIKPENHYCGFGERRWQE
jgi:hypothetical protein